MTVSPGLNRVCFVEATTDLVNWTPVFTNTTSTDGTFNFVDTPGQPQRYFRATALP